MHWCLRISPLIAAALLGLRARWLLGLFTGSSRTAAPFTSAPITNTGPWVLTSLRIPTSLAEFANLLRGAGSVVSQFFAWMYLVIALCAVWGLLRLVAGEIELRREFRHRSEPPGRAAWRAGRRRPRL